MGRKCKGTGVSDVISCSRRTEQRQRRSKDPTKTAILRGSRRPGIQHKQTTRQS